MFYDAIKAAYPQVKIIATTTVTSRPMDVIDQHYYNSAQFFEQASTLFDGYDRSGPLVFVGEYAATANAGALPTGLLGNSIGEAAFMTGMERNSDIVHMSSYAPLFCELRPHAVEPGSDRLRADQQLRVDLLLGPADVRAQRRREGAAGHRQRQRPVLLRDHRQPERPGLPKIVNPGAQDVPAQIAFGGRTASAASIEVLGSPDPQAGNTLANPDAVVPSRGTLHGPNGVFSYQVPASSLTVVKLAR